MRLLKSIHSDISLVSILPFLKFTNWIKRKCNKLTSLPISYILAHLELFLLIPSRKETCQGDADIVFLSPWLLTRTQCHHMGTTSQILVFAFKIVIQ
jgi:hypothetical protein